VTRLELIVIDAADQQRQLGAEVCRQVDGQPIAKLVKNRRKDLPGDLLVRTKIVADLVQPDVGGLKGSVEDVESARAHNLLLKVNSRRLATRTLGSSGPFLLASADAQAASLDASGARSMASPPRKRRVQASQL
jgi:hypothetical protein